MYIYRYVHSSHPIGTVRHKSYKYTNIMFSYVYIAKSAYIIYIHNIMYSYVYIAKSAYMYVCMCMYVYVCMYVCMYVCIYVYMYMHIYIHIYIHTYIRILTHYRDIGTTPQKKKRSCRRDSRVFFILLRN